MSGSRKPERRDGKPNPGADPGHGRSTAHGAVPEPRTHLEVDGGLVFEPLLVGLVEGRKGRVLVRETPERSIQLLALRLASRLDRDRYDRLRRRKVRRIRGAAPGLVSYAGEQTIRVMPRGHDSEA